LRGVVPVGPKIRRAPKKTDPTEKGFFGKMEGLSCGEDIYIKREGKLREKKLCWHRTKKRGRGADKKKHGAFRRKWLERLNRGLWCKVPVGKFRGEREEIKEEKRSQRKAIRERKKKLGRNAVQLGRQKRDNFYVQGKGREGAHRQRKRFWTRGKKGLTVKVPNED